MKFVRQRDSMQCGASCLKMICDEYKGTYSYEELSELCSVTSEGVSMLLFYHTYIKQRNVFDSSVKYMVIS